MFSKSSRQPRDVSRHRRASTSFEYTCVTRGVYIFGAVLSCAFLLTSHRLYADELPSPKTSTRDAAIQVFVPAGSFLRGSSRAEHAFGYMLCARDLGDSCRATWFDSELPQKMIHMSSFWLDKYEVSNEMYALCVREGGCTERQISQCTMSMFGKQVPVEMQQWTRSFSKPDLPAVCATWTQARDYCRWAGRTLPSEAQWERAARGDDGRIFPWGMQSTPCTHAHSLDPKTDAGCGQRRARPVRSASEISSPFGAVNLSGNAEEWVRDVFIDRWYTRETSRVLDPVARDSEKDNMKKMRSAKGGSWKSDLFALRAAQRSAYVESTMSVYLGFRCAETEGQEAKTPTF